MTVRILKTAESNSKTMRPHSFCLFSHLFRICFAGTLIINSPSAQHPDLFRKFRIDLCKTNLVAPAEEITKILAKSETIWLTQIGLIGIGFAKLFSAFRLQNLLQQADLKTITHFVSSALCYVYARLVSAKTEDNVAVKALCYALTELEARGLVNSCRSGGGYGKGKPTTTWSLGQKALDKASRGVSA